MGLPVLMTAQIELEQLSLVVQPVPPCRHTLAASSEYCWFWERACVCASAAFSGWPGDLSSSVAVLYGPDAHSIPITDFVGAVV